MVSKFSNSQSTKDKLTLILFKTYFFESAHYMPTFSKKHSYGNIHGHTFEITVFVKGKKTPSKGWVMDFKKIDAIVNPLIRKIDHKLLNDVKGLENPTSENIAIWFWKNIKKKIPNLKEIEINRPRVGGCSYSE
tara:strand:+ start:20 stop:421 length:402 start_codon:yes stop_codon:yes gene_type:complete